MLFIVIDISVGINYVFLHQGKKIRVNSEATSSRRHVPSLQTSWNVILEASNQAIFFLINPTHFGGGRFNQQRN